MNRGSLLSLNTRFMTGAVIFFYVLFHSVSAVGQLESVDSLKVIYLQNPDTAKRLEALMAYLHSIPLMDFDARMKTCNAGIQLAVLSRDSLKLGQLFSLKGSSFYFKGVFDSAAHYFYKSVYVLEKKNFKKELAHTLNNLARLYRKKREFPRALGTYERAMNIFTELGDSEGIATIYNESGVVYEYMGDFGEAERRYKASLNIHIQRKDSIGISYAYSNIGYLYISLKKYKPAEEYLLKALEIRKNLKDSFALALNYNELGELYAKSGKFAKALDFIGLSMNIAAPKGYLDLLMDNYKKKAEVSAMMGNFKNAYGYYITYSALKDSIYKVDVEARIEEVSARYETEKKEAENELLKKTLELRDLEIENRKNQNRVQKLTLFLISILLVFGMVVALFIYFRKRRELQIKLEAEVNQARDNERRRISRDLHDNLGAQMSYLIALMDNSNVSQIDKPLLTAMRDTTRQAIMTLRETVWAINQKEISVENFSDKFKQYVLKQTEYLSGIEVVFKDEIKIEKALGPAVALNIFRLCQEAFSNALKHSGASRILVTFRSDEEFDFYFSVEDNGVGFDVENGAKDGHYGLGNMQARAEESGAILKISSQKGSGTKVEVFSAGSKQNER